MIAKLQTLLLIASIYAVNALGQVSETVYTGDATFYLYQGGGNCSFPYPYTKIYSAALNAPQYGNSELCGACAEVTGPRGTFTVSIQDQCPECKVGDLDFERDAFPLIADPIEGRVRISWKIVPCPVEGPVIFHFKEGSHQWWTGVQVRNHRYPLARFEYRTPGGSYKEVSRLNYNYFVEETGMGVGPLDFRITDIHGQVIESRNITLSENTSVQGDSQFPLIDVVTDIKKVENESVYFFPNPSFSKEGQLLNQEKTEIQYELYDLSGMLLEKNRIMEFSGRKIEFPTSGTYILKYTNNNGINGFNKLIIY